MAITTTNGKLAIMELDQDYEPGLPLSPGTIGQDDQQQLLWGFPEVLWEAAVAGQGIRAVVPGRRLRAVVPGRRLRAVVPRGN